MPRGSGGQSKEKRSVPVPVIVVALLVLAVFLVWWGRKNFVPERPKLEPKLQAQTDAYLAWLHGLVKKTGGDFSKLSPQEQAELNGKTMGHAQDAWTRATNGDI